MSNKNIFIVLLICLFLGAAYYFTANKGSFTEIASLVSDSSSPVIPLDKSSQGELDPESLIRSLNSQMLLVGMINPRNIDPAVNHFESIKEKFTKTKLWTKLDLDSMISSQMGGDFSSPASSPQGMPKSSTEIFDLIKNEWKGIKEVALAVSSNTSPVDGPADEPINFPKILLAFNFNDEASRNKVKGIVSSQFPKDQNIYTQDALTLERSKENPDLYSITVKSPFGAPLIGSIEFVGNQGLVTFGTKQKGDFFTAKAGGSSEATPLIESEIWKQAEPSILPSAGSFIFADIKGVAKISSEIEKITNVGEDPDAKPVLATNTFDEIGGVGFSSTFTDGVKLRTCGVINNKDIASRYRAMLNWAQADKDSESASPSLVTNQTVFATSLSGHFIQAYIDNFLSVMNATTLEELKNSGEKHSPETKRTIENYFALNKLLKNNPIRSISIVINAPQAAIGIDSVMGGMPPIDSNVLIEFKNGMTPGNFAKLSTKIITLFLADSGLVDLPSVKVAPAFEGVTGQVIEVISGAKPQFYGLPISENGILFGNTQKSVLDAKKTIEQPSAVISEEALSTRGLKSLISTAGLSTYLSSIPIVQQLHTLAPEALSMAPKEMQLKIEDVKEVLDLLNFRVFGLQNSSQASEEVYCADMRGIAL